MGTGAITGYLDVAQLVLYGFWIFFFGLIFWLQRESKREGYPMHSDRPGRPYVPGMLPMPPQKTYRLENGGSVTVPRGPQPHQALEATPIGNFPGASLVPEGDPMAAGMGPGAWNARADVPELSFHGEPVIQPLRRATRMFVAAEDRDPRGLPVLGADGDVAGRVVDCWVDVDECQLRYLEVALGDGGRRLLPIHFGLVGDDAVRVQALLAAQFAGVPALRDPDTVTKLEEDKICAWYGAGTLYATPRRAEAML